MILGYTFALLTSLGMSLYITPKKLSKHIARDYNVFLAMGFSICCMIYFLVTSNISSLNNKYLLFSCLTGVIWTIKIHKRRKKNVFRKNQWTRRFEKIGS